MKTTTSKIRWLLSIISFSALCVQTPIVRAMSEKRIYIGDSEQKAGYLLTKIARQAQQDVGVPKDRQATIYNLSSFSRSCGALACASTSITGGDPRIEIDSSLLSKYGAARFASLHEGTHILNEDSANKKQRSIMILLAGILGGGIVGWPMLGFCGGALAAIKWIDYSQIVRENRADTTAVIALKCKTCLNEYIEYANLEKASSRHLKKGYLSADQMRALSEQYHPDTSCYYHSSPIPRIFHTIQSTPFAGTQVDRVVKKYCDQRENNFFRNLMKSSLQK